MPATATDRLSGLSTSVAVKPPCRVVSTASLTLSALQTVNSVACVDGDRVLQAIPGGHVNNGIWVVRAGAWERAKDFDGTRDVVKGTLVLVAPATASALIYVVSTASPIVPGTTVVAIDPFSGDSASLRSDLASSGAAGVGAGMVGLGISLAYATATSGKAFADRMWCITDAPFNAVAGAADNYAAILAAQTALAAAGGGTLVVPRGTFRILTAIPRVSSVDIVGLGWSSILNAHGCGAFTYGFTTGFGRSATRNLWIQGSNGTTQIGIYQAGTLNDADELYGVVIEGCAITGFLTGIQFRTVRNFTITNNWIQDVTSGINLIGKCLVGFIHHNQIVEAAGPGAGTQRGVYLNSFNYTSGTGTVGPEGIRIEAGHIQGFEYCIDIAFGTEVRIVSPDISASRIGIRWSSATSLSITGGYVQVTGALAEFGIHAAAQSVINQTKYLVKGVNINAVSAPAGASGIMIGTRAVTGNVDYLTVEDCEFSGWTSYDIEQLASGNNHYLRNHCNSSGTTQSMLFTNTFVTRPTYVDGNKCAKLISYTLTDAGLVLGSNTESGTVLNRGGSQTLTGAGAVSLNTLRTLLVTTGVNAWTLADGYDGQEKRLVMKTFAGNGTLTPTNLHNGNTLTFDNVGDSSDLVFMDGQWNVMGGSATLA